jgi:hypothetical protein
LEFLIVWNASLLSTNIDHTIKKNSRFLGGKMNEKKGQEDRPGSFLRHVGEIVKTNPIAEVAKIMDYHTKN